ncbi:uncharacterized protein [Nothobranchius furzeri]|uniref:Transcript variant X4 n=1 Tax=Nothobranchius furzeri TaxID=105023 RepID=A0A9D2Y3A2_NOTFU|nr:mucin-5AC [Nothobranchius furzeri]KAF7212508.1 transcript variant X4 [Nothobranchius furzeri]
MLDRVLLQVLTLLLLSRASRASSLGLTVQIAPLDTDGGKTVRAHFSVIAPTPCPDLSSVCAAGEDCQAHLMSLPFIYTKPSPQWCVRQWQKTVPSDYKALLALGPSTQFFVSINAVPKTRANNGKLNQPAYVALPPPLRARQNCPVDFSLSVKDLDGDRVRCRFARADRGECQNGTQHAFIKLDEENCVLSYTGNAVPGQYFIFLMAEDLIPVPTISRVQDISPLSSVPVHLSLSVEEWTSSCSNEPPATRGTPEKNAVLYALPYQEVKFSTTYNSDLESVLEIAVVGPPDLYRVNFASVGHSATLTMAWIRSENNLTRLLPICFVANTNSLQSELRCVWLFQKRMKTLPAGTELTCGETEMVLVLPVASLTEISLPELQLNSPTCSVTYNSTYLTAHISFGSCGTRAVHSGSELVYTNTLKSVRPYTMISRRPSLILPMACRIRAVQVKGPHLAISIPTERETFGDIRFWIEFHLPGQGPLARFTSTPQFRSNFLPLGRARRQVVVGTGSNTTTDITIGDKLKQLDLYVVSNCSVDRAELVVSSCIESETEDFANSQPILRQGCIVSNDTLEVITTTTTSKVFRLFIDKMVNSGSTMYVECVVNLCITTMPSDKCPDLCTGTSSSSLPLVESVFTRTYTVRSGPVSLLANPPAQTTENFTTLNNNAETTTPTPTTSKVTTPASSSTSSPTSNGAVITSTSRPTTSHGPGLATSTTTGVILTTVLMFLWVNIFS